MSDKKYGIYGINADINRLKLEEPQIDIDRLIRAKSPTELLIVIYPEVKRIRGKYKGLPACSRNLDNLRYDLDNLCKQILFCFDYNGCAMRPMVPCDTNLPYQVQATIDAAMRLLDIANELLPVSLDELILGLTHGVNPC